MKGIGLTGLGLYSNGLFGGLCLELFKCKVKWNISPLLCWFEKGWEGELCALGGQTHRRRTRCQWSQKMIHFSWECQFDGNFSVSPGVCRAASLVDWIGFGTHCWLRRLSTKLLLLCDQYYIKMGLCGSNANANTGMKLSTASMVKRRGKGEFVIYISHGTNLPNMDLGINGDMSDCYAKIQLQDAKGVPCSPEFKTQVRQDTLNPTWNMYAAFPIQPLDTDIVLVTIMDHDDLSRDDFIGCLQITVAKLRQHSVAKPGEFVLTMKTTVHPQQKDQPVTIALGTLQNNECCNPLREQDSCFEVEKEFWLIRHGESKWNEATDNKDVGGLMGYDHPLNKVGIEQALLFNGKWTKAQKEVKAMTVAEKKFLVAERVIASPLTRATQTALLTCHGHLNLNGKKDKPLFLFRNLREKKNKSLSLDTVGECVGAGIAKRVLEQMIAEEWKDNPAKAQQYMEDINYNDCDSAWWTGKSHGDSKGMMTSRYDELWGYLKYMKEKSAVLVGHSLFFRELCQRYLGADYCKEQGTFTDRLKAHKLDNASCLYIRVRFPKPNAVIKKEPQIVEAELVFGSRLKEPHEADEDNFGCLE